MAQLCIGISADSVMLAPYQNIQCWLLHFNHIVPKGTNLNKTENSELQDSLSGSEPVRYSDIHSFHNVNI